MRRFFLRFLLLLVAVLSLAVLGGCGEKEDQLINGEEKVIFSGGSYDAQAKTLTLDFRTTGVAFLERINVYFTVLTSSHLKEEKEPLDESSLKPGTYSVKKTLGIGGAQLVIEKVDPPAECNFIRVHMKWEWGRSAKTPKADEKVQWVRIERESEE